jgi:hypothetical protein
VRESEDLTGRVIAFPRRPDHDPELTYPQLAAELGVSKRYLQLRCAEGMPSVGLDYAGKRRFRLSEATRWLDARQARMGRTMRDVRSPLPREAS